MLAVSVLGETFMEFDVKALGTFNGTAEVSTYGATLDLTISGPVTLTGSSAYTSPTDGVLTAVAEGQTSYTSSSGAVTGTSTVTGSGTVIDTNGVLNGSGMGLTFNSTHLPAIYVEEAGSGIFTTASFSAQFDVNVATTDFSLTGTWRGPMYDLSKEYTPNLAMTDVRESGTGYAFDFVSDDVPFPSTSHTEPVGVVDFFYASAASADESAILEKVGSYESVYWNQASGSLLLDELPEVPEGATHIVAAIRYFAATEDNGVEPDVSDNWIAVPLGASSPTIEDLGVVDFLEQQDVALDTNGLYYELETAHDGLLVTEVVSPSPSDSAQFRLYDSNPLENTGLTPLATTALSGDGHQRLAHVVQAGETYFLEMYGANSDTDFRISNQVEIDGSTVTIHGTSDADPFVFDATAGSIEINGVGYDIVDETIDAVTFDGGEGDDTAVLTGSTGDEIAQFFPDRGTFGDSEYLVTVNDVVEITAHGGGGTDAAFLYDSAGDDEFVARKGYGKLSGEGFALETFDFTTNYGYATTRDGGHDVATMEDSPGNDKFKFDWPKAGQFFGKMYGGGEYYNRAKNFEQIDAIMTEGKDRVRLFDSEGDETFEGQQEESRLTGAGFDVTVSGYDTLAVYASEGLDIANLADSEDEDTTRARPHKITFWGGDDADPTYEIMARRFDEYHFTGGHGGTDRAKLHDTAYGDHLHAEGQSASFYMNDGELDLLYEVVAFDWVKLYTTDNGNEHTFEKEGELDFTLEFDDETMWDEGA